MQKPARKQGRNTQLECYVLAYARASAKDKKDRHYDGQNLVLLLNIKAN